MILDKITYDILKILERFKITDDHRVSLKYLESKIAQYRAEKILYEYRDSGEVNPALLQSLGEVNLTQVPKSDDPIASICDCTFSKVTIPQVVGLPGDMGVYRVSSLCRTKKYYPITIDRFLELPKGSIRAKFNYYFRVGQALYLTPYIKEANIQLILNDPLEGWNLRTDNIPSGNLKIGPVYKVVSGNITHNDVRYFKGDVFVAVGPTFTGTGLVQFNDQKVKLTPKDDYPMDYTMVSYIIMKILTQDFSIEANQVSDILNDAQDQANTKT